jgi:hypothetical protein
MPSEHQFKACLILSAATLPALGEYVEKCHTSANAHEANFSNAIALLQRGAISERRRVLQVFTSFVYPTMSLSESSKPLSNALSRAGKAVKADTAKPSPFRHFYLALL